MIRLTYTSIQKVIVHQIRNKSNDEGFSLSEDEMDFNEDLGNVLLKYFLGHFSGEQQFVFYHESEIDLNPSYTYSSRIFSRSSNFQKQSENYAKHLYECSIHPKVKSGELYVAYFKDVTLNEERVDAIGIFKSESKETFLSVDKIRNSFRVKYHEGSSTNRMDKGALICNTKEGLRVCVVDNTNRGIEAQYWLEDFLRIKPLENEYHQTQEFLALTKVYASEKYHQEFDATKADEIDLLSRSVEYFKKNNSYDKRDFEKEVLQQPDVIKSFRKFNDSYKEENEIDIPDNFEISTHAVKAQAKKMKSVLKLDKNFHVYIHGDQSKIEQGMEKDGRKYYKIYFDQES